MLAATAMGDTPCGIFAQTQRPGAYPHSFFIIPYSMKGLAAASLATGSPDPMARHSAGRLPEYTPPLHLSKPARSTA